MFIHRLARWQRARPLGRPLLPSLLTKSSSPPLLTPAVPRLSPLTASAAPLMGIRLLVKYPQVSAALWQGRRQKRETKSERTAAGVLRSLSDVTHSQIRPRYIGITNASSGRRTEQRDQGSGGEIRSQCSPPAVIWPLLLAFPSSLTLQHKETLGKRRRGRGEGKKLRCSK